MKKIAIVLSLLLIAFSLYGCGKTDNSSLTEAAPLSQNNERTGTLQGKIMDAITGAAIGNGTDSELHIWLIQGTDNRGPSKLINDTNDPLCGEYAFSGIPIDLYLGNATFKVVVVKSGYQRFEADVELTSSVSPTLISSTFDSVINMIGNIYLFPIGYLAGDVNIIVRDPAGVPIPNAAVIVYQDVENNNTSASDSVTSAMTNTQSGLNPNDDRLYPTGGLYMTLTATTDTSGIATISGTTLVLGGQYIVKVAEMTFNGQLLGWGTATANLVVSTVNPNVYVNMTVHSGTSSLFATSASNQVPGTATSTGVLTIVFNQPIVMTTSWFTATLSVGSNGTVTATPPLATGAISADGLTLTITPVWATAPTSTDLGSSITYTYNVGNQILVDSTQVSGGLWLTNIPNVSTGANLSGTVKLYNY